MPDIRTRVVECGQTVGTAIVDEHDVILTVLVFSVPSQSPKHDRTGFSDSASDFCRTLSKRFR